MGQEHYGSCLILGKGTVKNGAGTLWELFDLRQGNSEGGESAETLMDVRVE